MCSNSLSSLDGCYRMIYTSLIPSKLRKLLIVSVHGHFWVARSTTTEPRCCNMSAIFRYVSTRINKNTGQLHYSSSAKFRIKHSCTLPMSWTFRICIKPSSDSYANRTLVPFWIYKSWSWSCWNDLNRITEKFGHISLYSRDAWDFLMTSFYCTPMLYWTSIISFMFHCLSNETDQT